MKKSLLCILVLLLVAVGVKAIPVPTGYMLAPNYYSGAPGFTYGTYNVQTFILPVAAYAPALPWPNAGCTDTLPPPTPFPLITPPGPTTAGTNRIGGPGTGIIYYTFNKPVYKVFIMYSGLNTGEKVRVSYPPYLPSYYSLSNFECTFTDCYSGPPAGTPGPCFLNALGEIEGPACCGAGASSPYNGGTINVTYCDGFTTFAIECTGTSGGINAALFFDTLRPAGCSEAFANSPCEPDTLQLWDSGDSLNWDGTRATYFWTGPASFTSTDQNPFRFPTAAAMSGTYKAYKTQTLKNSLGGIYTVNDTDTVNVVVHPRAYINTIGSNSPLCESPLDTLQLRITTPGVTGETYVWSGPNLFTSTSKNPDLYGFVASDSGTYKVVATTPFGCADSATTYVKLRPIPDPPKIIGPSPYCYGAPFVPFTTSGVTGGGTVLWYTTGFGGVGSTTAPTINTTVPGNTTVYASQVEAIYCESARDSIIITVLPKISPEFTWTSQFGCDSDAVTFTNTSTGAQWYAWDYGEGMFSADTTNKLLTQTTYGTHKVHTVVLHAYTPGCEEKATGYVNTTHSIKAAFRATPETFCAGGTTIMDDSATTMLDSTIVTKPLTGYVGDGSGNNFYGSSLIVDTANVYTVPATPSNIAADYKWAWGDGTFDVTNTRTPLAHRYDSGGVYTIKLTATDSIGCIDTISHDVNAIKLFVNSFHDTMLCISQPLLLNVKSLPKPLLADQHYSYVWTPNIYLDDTTVQQPYYDSRPLPDVVTTYTLVQTNTQYGCYAIDTIRIHAVIGKKLANVTIDQTILYGQSIQLNSDSEVYYLWKNNDGTLNNPNINNPVARPLETTMYAVYGYDKNGCLDSAYVLVRVDSSMMENIPSGFTPNGDGLNDVFRPVGIQYQNLVDFRVYNRLGQQVFYSNSYKNGWDGTYKGVPQDLGTYTYVIIVARPGGDGENIVHKGTVTLIR